MTANLQVEAINIQAKCSNPYGEYEAKPLKNYVHQNLYNGSELEDKKYQNIQNAEANYYKASNLIANSAATNTIKNYNTMARMLGYNNVNMLHRHDVD